MKKKARVALAMITLVVAVLGLTACNQQGATGSGAQATDPEYMDKKALEVIARGYELRSDYLAKNPEDSAAKLKGAVQTEIDNDADLKNAKFEDSKLQETVIAYLNALDGQMAALDNNQYNSADYYLAWDEAYDQRSTILKTLVEDYGLTMREKDQESLNEIVKNGGAVNKDKAEKKAIDDLLSSAKWEKTEESPEYYTYTAVVENTTEYSFKNVSVIVGLYDADDVRTEAYASAQNWRKGEKVKLEAYGNEVDAKRVDATVQYFEIAE